MSTEVLTLTGVSKRFGSTVAVDDLHLGVESGSFLGLIGPNGAGKTTALSIAVGLTAPDAGTVRVAGIDVGHDPEAAKAVLGVLPDGLGLPARLTGRELLTYLGLLRGLPVAVVDARTDELLDVFGLDRAGRTLIADYSTGMRKKVGLAAALLHNPRVLVLDEPFEAVDPVSAATVRTILGAYTAAGGAVVCSSHIMAVVETVCDRIAVMVAGRRVACGTTEEVKAGGTLDDAFATLVGAVPRQAGLSWLGP